MKIAQLSRDDGTVVCERCVVADRPLRRMRGLLGRRTLPSDEGIWLKPAGSIHMFFMRFAIDCLFLDQSMSVVAVKTVKPWRTAAAKGAKSVVELAEGEAERRGVRLGDRLRLTVT